MKIPLRINLALLILLSLSTALVKLLGMEAEMTLFKNAGWSELLVIIFGLIQLIGGIFLIPSKTRKTGALIMLLSFSIATVVLFINHMIPFGTSSILFILMALIPLLKPVNLINDKI